MVSAGRLCVVTRGDPVDEIADALTVRCGNESVKDADLIEVQALDSARDRTCHDPEVASRVAAMKGLRLTWKYRYRPSCEIEGQAAPDSSPVDTSSMPLPPSRWYIQMPDWPGVPGVDERRVFRTTM